MLDEWRADGWTYEQLELWAVGYPGQEEDIDGMNGEDRDESIFIDSVVPEENALTAFGAHNNDVFFIDSAGCLRGVFNTGVYSLYTDSHREALDTIIRDILEEEPPADPPPDVVEDTPEDVPDDPPADVPEDTTEP